MKRLSCITGLFALLAITPFAQGITTSIPQGDIVIELELVCDATAEAMAFDGVKQETVKVFLLDTTLDL